MKFLAVLCLATVAFAYEDALRAVLKSPAATLKVYRDFKAKEHLKFDNLEDRTRFRMFRKNMAMVASFNEVFEDTANYGINMFSAMTSDEKVQYLGLNVTGHEANPEDIGFRTVSAPAKKLWTNEGAVTKVKNQGSCGSCWTFGAVGGLETRYQQVSGILRSFAEQEYLDCVYTGRDGCQGGWMSDCYDYSKSKGGRLAANSVYTYTAKDGQCYSGSKADAAISAKIMGDVPVAKSESANIEALAVGSLAMAVEVTNKFHQYRSGVMRDTSCSGRVNHAVTGVGYTENFVLVKNSWGATWGDQGFIKFARNYGNCGLFDYSSFPKLEKTGKSDSKSDAATDYRPSEDDDVGPDPNPNPDCKDKASNCADLTKYCYHPTIKDYCQKTCGECDDDNDGECPSGTIRCPDGICRHEHMC